MSRLPLSTAEVSMMLAEKSSTRHLGKNAKTMRRKYGDGGVTMVLTGGTGKPTFRNQPLAKTGKNRQKPRLKHSTQMTVTIKIR